MFDIWIFLGMFTQEEPILILGKWHYVNVLPGSKPLVVPDNGFMSGCSKLT